MMNESNPTVGLYGIGGTYNYGCEAIIRGTEKILKNIYPDGEIVYASLRPDDDKKRLSESEVKIVKRKLKSFPSVSRINGILSYNTGYYLNGLFNEDISWADECDLILSIGGDLYTLPHNHKKRRFRPYFNPLIQFGEIMMNLNKEFIIWGASVGPFENDNKAKKVFVNHLKKVDLITSREPVTTSYLKDLGIYRNVIESPDPAFMLKNPIIKNEKKSGKKELIIGLNLSPLSAAQLDIKNETNYYISLIRKLVEKFNANLVLIPHVVSDFNLLDDDLRYLKSIYDNLPEDLMDNVKIAEHDPGYLGIRGTLQTCDIVIASRMHCCINAISIGIPTIFLSYSKKSVGMSQFIYNNSKFVFPLNKITDESFLTLLKYVVYEKENLKKYLIRRLSKMNFNNINPSFNMDK